MLSSRAQGLWEIGKPGNLKLRLFSRSQRPLLAENQYILMAKSAGFGLKQI